jgi:hypothetical protein
MPTYPNANANPYGAYDPIKESLLYPLDNPEYAYNNAMSDVGINPYSANPFAKAMKRMAPSLGASYLVEQSSNNRANTPAGIARTGQGYADGQHTSMPFSTYLRASASGQNVAPAYNMPGDPSGEYPTMGTAAQNVGTSLQWLPNAIGDVRTYRNNLNNGSANMSNINPFMAAFSDQLAAGNGQGTVDLASNLMSPWLAPAMASSYRNALTASLGNANRKLAAEPLNTTNDIWTYLMGY